MAGTAPIMMGSIVASASPTAATLLREDLAQWLEKMVSRPKLDFGRVPLRVS